jgi:hypothetical protein
MTIKFKYLMAWDTMMGSFGYWKEMMQAKAEEENAPLTAVYKAHDGSWIKFEDVRSDGTRLVLAGLLADMGIHICPKCLRTELEEEGLNALSRKDNETEICNDCGTREAMEEIGL